MNMNEPTARRSLVPGPSSTSGIANKAVAAREAAREQGSPDHMMALRREGQVQRFASPPVIGNLAKAIASVMANVGTIEKGGYNAFHRYKYARMEDLLVALTPLIGKAGLAIFQNEVEIKQIENRVAVTYEFIIAHESGEQAPPQRFTGMSIARDSKGNWDDKCLNKCHTQARKYFLLSMFQVPAGDFEEADAGPAQEDANQRQEKAPVPGPSKDAAPARSAQDQAAQQAVRASQKATEDGIPHKIILGQGAGADQWAATFIRVVGKCTSRDEINRWDAANDQALQSMSQHYPEVYDMIGTAVARRISDLETPPPPAAKAGLGNGSGMPDPKQNAQEAMNWVAAQLQQLGSWEGAKEFWNQHVAPRDKDFDQLDWEMLMEEWKRTELRLAPPDDDDVATTQGLS